MAQRVKDPTLLPLWLGSQLWRRFDSWPWNISMLWAQPKKEVESEVVNELLQSHHITNG